MSTGDSKQKVIMVVEDDQLLGNTIVKVLETAGYKAQALPDGYAAQNLIGLNHFDLVISDIRMPDVNGIELLSFIQEQYPIPVILITGFSELADASDAAELGAAGFLSKPFKREELLETVHKILGHSSQGAEKESEATQQYIGIPIEEFVTNTDIRHAIHLRTSQNKYVKMANEGQVIAGSEVATHKAKGLHQLYLTSQDFSDYIGYHPEMPPPAPTPETARRISAVLDACADFLKFFRNERINSTVYECAVQATISAVSLIAQYDCCLLALEKQKDAESPQLARSLGISVFSAMLAQECGGNSIRTKFKAALTALLHDECQNALYHRKFIQDPAAPVERIVSFASDFIEHVIPHDERPPLSYKEALPLLQKSAHADTTLINGIFRLFHHEKNNP